MIDIQTEKPELIQKVAPYIDKYDFIKKIEDLREIITIDITPPNYPSDLPSIINYWPRSDKYADDIQSEIKYLSWYYLTTEQRIKFMDWFNDDKYLLRFSKQEISIAQVMKEASQKLIFDFKMPRQFFFLIQTIIIFDKVYVKHIPTTFTPKTLKNIVAKRKTYWFLRENKQHLSIYMVNDEQQLKIEDEYISIRGANKRAKEYKDFIDNASLTS